MTDEIWLPIKGFEGMYEVSNKSRVRSMPRKYTISGNKRKVTESRVLIQHREIKLGRPFISVRLGADRANSRFKVARLVAEAFLEPPYPNWVIKYKDDNPDNISINNLIIQERVVKNTQHYEKELISKRFGSLVVVRRDEKKRVWVLKCDCGKEIISDTKHLRVRPPRFCSFSCNLKKLTQNATNSLFVIYKNGAIKRKYDFTLTIDQFKKIIKEDCYYCGLKPTNELNRQFDKIKYSGIDRVDNTIGYILSNCVPCCKF